MLVTVQAADEGTEALEGHHVQGTAGEYNRAATRGPFLTQRGF